MRAVALTMCLFATAAIPAAALAQQGATRSVDDYVCAFTDDCADAAAEDEASAAEKGATEVTIDGRKARSSSTRGFSLARPKPADAKTAKPGTKAATQTAGKARVGGKKKVATASTGGKESVKTASVSKSKASADASRRVDLRLTFELGSATLTPQAMEEARVFAEALKGDKLSDRRFMIEGHTDSIGGRDYNLDLSRRRAQAVKEYLVSLGVPPARLETVGYGFDRPLDGRSARAEENRRVEAVLVS